MVRQSSQDKVCLVGAGVTLAESLKAAEILSGRGIAARVVDPFTVKPLDGATLSAAVAACGGRVVVTEDHYPEGGLGEAVAGALVGQQNLQIRRLAVGGIPAQERPPSFCVYSKLMPRLLWRPHWKCSELEAETGCSSMC